MHCRHHNVFDQLDIERDRHMDLHCTCSLILVHFHFHLTYRTLTHHRQRSARRRRWWRWKRRMVGRTSPCHCWDCCGSSLNHSWEDHHHGTHCHHRSVLGLWDIGEGRHMDLGYTYNLDLLLVSMHESLQMFVGHLVTVVERE